MTGGGLGGSQSNLTDLSVSGFSTFTGPIDANGNLDVDGHTELDEVNVSGFTFNSTLIFRYQCGAQASNTLCKIEDLTDNHVVIAGTGGNLDVDGHTELDDVNVMELNLLLGLI